MVRPSFAMKTASGAYKAIIASTFPELNRSISDGITPSGSVGSGKDSDIRDLLFGVVEPRCGDDAHGPGRQWQSYRMIVFAGRRSVGLRAATASSRVERRCSSAVVRPAPHIGKRSARLVRAGGTPKGVTRSWRAATTTSFEETPSRLDGIVNVRFSLRLSAQVGRARLPFPELAALPGLATTTTTPAAASAMFVVKRVPFDTPFLVRVR